MAEFEVNCITKPDRESRHEHITHIGNSNNGWQLTREAGKAPFLRTYADGKWNDNLLAQRECGASCKLVA
jgi:hypothetical protein